MNFRFAMVVLLATLLAAPAISHAQPARTFLASTGSDANACTPAAPCRTLGVAVGAVATGGDVIILDSGGYGENVTIAKSVSVIAQPGVVARIRSSVGSNGIVINGPAINVTIDGLGVTGTGGYGISFLAGASLLLKNMDINIDNKQNGHRGVSHIALGGAIGLQNVTLRNTHNCFRAEVTIADTTFPAKATIVDTHAFNCVNGFVASYNSVVSIVRSSASGSRKDDTSACNANFYSVGVPSYPAVLTLETVVSANCATGVFGSNAKSFIALSNMLITGNSTAANSAGAAGTTFGNNRVYDNTSDVLTGFTAATFR